MLILRVSTKIPTNTVCSVNSIALHGWSVENLFRRTKAPRLALHSRMTTRSSLVAHRNTFPLLVSWAAKVWQVASSGVT